MHCKYVSNEPLKITDSTKVGICHQRILLFMFCDLSFTFYDLCFMFYDLELMIYNLQFTFYDL